MLDRRFRAYLPLQRRQRNKEMLAFVIIALFADTHCDMQELFKAEKWEEACTKYVEGNDHFYLSTFLNKRRYSEAIDAAVSFRVNGTLWFFMPTFCIANECSSVCESLGGSPQVFED